MHEGPVPAAIRDFPYFLISYPHTERWDQGSDGDPDYWVTAFYKDLCRSVEELIPVPAGARVGVLDREFWIDDDWLSGLPDALATCRVLVPLYSSRYFESEACGKEWQAFALRGAAHRDTGVGQAPAIVPVLWDPTDLTPMPAVARAVPVEYGGLDSYVKDGLYGLTKRGRPRPDYDQVVRGLARRIVETAGRLPVGPWPTVDFDSLPNPFALAFTPKSAKVRLFITVAAPHWGDLPPGRSGGYYGSTARDWAPYRPTAELPIATHAAKFARRLGYTPHIGDLREHEESLLAVRSAPHPMLLIVDPWAVLRPAAQRLFTTFNLTDKPWIQVVIPWNPGDRETTAAHVNLRLALDSALRGKLERGRAISEKAVDGIPTMDDFEEVLPLLIPWAGKRYLGHASASPPDGPPMDRPTFDGFTPDPANYLERTGG